MEETTNKPATKIAKTRKPKAVTEENIVNYRFDDPPRCSVTGQTVKEAGRLYQVHETVFLSPAAIRGLNIQHAEEQAKLRG